MGEILGKVVHPGPVIRQRIQLLLTLWDRQAVSYTQQKCDKHAGSPTAPLVMHVRRLSDEEPPIIRREVTPVMQAARNRAADEVLAQISGDKAKRTK